MTAFNALQAALKAALSAAPALAAGNIQTNRLRAIPAASAGAIVLRLEGSAAVEAVLGANDWGTRFTVECYARATPGQDPADAVDALVSDVWARIGALQPAAIDAMSVAINPTLDWQYDEADAGLCAAIFSILITHRTPANSLAAWP